MPTALRSYHITEMDQITVCDTEPGLSLARLLHDRELTEPEKQKILDNYFHDIYHLFLRTFILSVEKPTLTEKEEAKLRRLLEEVIKIKKLFP